MKTDPLQIGFAFAVYGFVVGLLVAYVIVYIRGSLKDKRINELESENEYLHRRLAAETRIYDRLTGDLVSKFHRENRYQDEPSNFDEQSEPEAEYETVVERDPHNPHHFRFNRIERFYH